MELAGAATTSGVAAGRRAGALAGAATATLGADAGVRAEALAGAATTAGDAASARTGAVAGAATVGAAAGPGAGATTSVMVRTDVALGVRFDGAGARNAHSETDTTPVTAVTPRATTTTLDARDIPAAFAATVAEAFPAPRGDRGGRPQQPPPAASVCA